MKFKIGDKVRLKRGIDKSNDCEYCGKCILIGNKIGIIKNYYKINGSIDIYPVEVDSIGEHCTGFNENDLELVKPKKIINWEKEIEDE